MAVIIVTDLPAEVTPDVYRQVSDVVAAGGPVPGLVFHTGFVKDGRIQVVDGWESRELFDAFEQSRLVPAIVQVVGPEAMSGPPDRSEHAPLDLQTG